MIGPRAAAHRRRRRALAARIALLLLGAGVVFALGIGLGIALEENERTGDTRTYVRTLTPGRLPPIARTVTVTVTGD